MAYPDGETPNDLVNHGRKENESMFRKLRQKCIKDNVSHVNVTQSSAISTHESTVHGLGRGKNSSLFWRLNPVIRRLFQDPDFPADDSVLFHKRPNGKIKWLRPYQMTDQPMFLGPGASRFDVRQGSIGLLKHCIPDDQGFDQSYIGIFHFLFWRYGEWIDVIIDDRLPTIDGKLIYLHSVNRNEFWTALIEKAYAKLYGSYECIHGGFTGWALQDLTGGIVETFSVRESLPGNIKKAIELSVIKASLIGASIRVGDSPQRLDNGLITGHAYSLTGYASVQTTTGHVDLVRMRNPWGTVEWTGPYSDRSDLWATVPRKTQERMNVERRYDGEFWMPLNYFAKFFTNLDICHLSPESWHREPHLLHKNCWSAVVAHRQWRRGLSAGGDIYSPLFCFNPQFHLELKKRACIVVSLLQKYRICGEHRQFLPCAFHIFEAPIGRTKHLTQVYLERAKHVASSKLEAVRDMVGFFTLNAGSYVILPATAQAGMEGKFMLRIFSEAGSAARELDDVDAYTPISVSPSEQPISRELKRRFLDRANQDEEIDATCLHAILNEKDGGAGWLSLFKKLAPKSDGMPEEVCKSAVAMFDTDMNGRLNISEFEELMVYMRVWKETFASHITVRRNLLDTHILRTALGVSGFTVSNKTLEALVIRFSSRGLMKFNDFVLALMRLHMAYHLKDINAIIKCASIECEEKTKESGREH